MQELENIFKTKGALHHAYAIFGEREAVFLELRDFLENSVGLQTRGNPDFWHGQFDTFTTDDAQAISQSQGNLAFSEGKKIFVISTNVITESAQNALLKVFEEPTAGTHFFILLPQDILLPTLRSRLHTVNMSRIPLDMPSQGESLTSVLRMNLGERLEVVKELTSAISDDDKTKQDAIALLNSIEQELYTGGAEKNAKALSVCQSARESLYDNGAPVKMILENVMLTI